MSEPLMTSVATDDGEGMDGEATHDVPAARSDIQSVCLRNLLDARVGIFFFKDRSGRFILVSEDCAALTGRSPAEMIGLTDYDLTDDEHAAELEADERRIMATGEPLIDKEEVDRLADQQGTWVETSKFPLRDAAGEVIGTFGYSRDVTRRELAERELAGLAADLADAHANVLRAEAQLRAILTNSADGIARHDRNLRYQYINPAGEAFRGHPAEELLGRTDREVGMAERELRVYEAALMRVLQTGEVEEIDFPGLRRADGEDTWFHLSLAADLDATGTVVGVLTAVRDITHVKQAERVLSHRATHDPLTGLANRHLLMDRLSRALARLESQPGRLALFFIDIDRFKDVNDTYGHEVGDSVLVEVARRLERLAGPHDTIARLGGDEYILLRTMLDAEDEGAVAALLVQALALPFDYGSVRFPVSGSVGGVVTDDPHAGPTRLLQDADSAMYRAKAAGRNRYEIGLPQA